MAPVVKKSVGRMGCVTDSRPYRARDARPLLSLLQQPPQRFPFIPWRLVLPALFLTISERVSIARGFAPMLKIYALAPSSASTGSARWSFRRHS